MSGAIFAGLPQAKGHQPNPQTRPALIHTKLNSLDAFSDHAILLIFSRFVDRSIAAVTLAFPSAAAPSSTTAAAASAAPAQAMPNPAQIALAAARNLGMPTALPGQAAGALSGLGGGAGFQANPQLLAQVMRSAQQQAGNPGQCEWASGALFVVGKRIICAVQVLCVLRRVAVGKTAYWG